MNEIDIPARGRVEWMDGCLCIARSFNGSIKDVVDGYRKLVTYARVTTTGCLLVR
ncbi:hypothetical protein [Bacillus sp. JCM 19041]|uniref:hypothetical protein n=1 Tax=Bacillus sp. JCM 19041 TaxID=1460637 RepID=UPI0012E2B93C